MNSRCNIVVILLLAVSPAFADDPPDSASLALRAEQAIRGGRYRHGIRLLTRAIELNSDDAAQRFDPWLGGRRISAEDLAHGKAELEQMLRDRPLMGLFDGRDSELSAWASRQFGGERRGARIRYSSALPGDGYHGMDVVRIGKFSEVGRQWSRDFADLKNALQFEALWHCAVYELLKSADAQRFRRLEIATGDRVKELERSSSDAYDEVRNASFFSRSKKRDEWASRYAAAREDIRQEYVAEAVRLEYRTCQLTRGFYCDVYLPWVAEKRMDTNPRRWSVHIWRRPDDCQAAFPSLVNRYEAQFDQWFPQKWRPRRAR